MTALLRGAVAVEHAIRTPKQAGGPAIVPFLTGGFPDLGRFTELLADAAARADLIEVGVPFGDPVADGVSIQRSSRVALDRGASLRTILDAIADARVGVPVVLMSYVNPLLAFGPARLARECIARGIAGLVVPDLPLEEGEELRGVMAQHGLATALLVSPLTPPARLARIAAASTGFLYAVTVAGVTGSALEPTEVTRYLDRVRDVASVPVCAGFGIRTRADVARLRAHADGVIVGTALVDAILRGDSPSDFLDQLTRR